MYQQGYESAIQTIVVGLGKQRKGAQGRGHVARFFRKWTRFGYVFRAALSLSALSRKHRFSPLSPCLLLSSPSLLFLFPSLFPSLPPTLFPEPLALQPRLHPLPTTQCPTILASSSPAACLPAPAMSCAPTTLPRSGTVPCPPAGPRTNPRPCARPSSSSVWGTGPRLSSPTASPERPMPR